MSEKRDTSGPQFRADRPAEQEAVRTTIVGGRPPGSGQNVGPIPRGIEVLVKKASVDPEFRGLLLERRAGAAETIGLALDPAEVMMLTAVPQAQLETIVDQTSVPQQHRRTFLGTAAAAMLAALGIAAPGCGRDYTKGIQPDRPPVSDGIRPEKVGVTGIAPDKPPEPPAPSHGDRPDRPPTTKGIQPDRPPEEPESPTDKTESEPPQEPPRPENLPAPTGIRPDPPPTRGTRPDRP